MTCLLFPGRHHLLTNFQRHYLSRILGQPAEPLTDVDGKPLELNEPIDTLIWAVTSANHSNTRRNPLPAHRREVAIERFAVGLSARSFVYLIDDIGATPRFAEYVLKKIEVDSFGRFRLTPENTVVGCSTPAVIELYERLGFRILPFELADRDTEQYEGETPWQLLMRMVEADRQGRDWRTDACFVAKVAEATQELYRKYDFGQRIIEMYRRPVLTEDGDLTSTRDYNTYVRSFDEGAQRKYDLVKDLVLPGRIVDIGCCTGSLLAALTRDERLHESDFYGIEIARQLYVECLHRKQQGAFANDHVFFYQRDFATTPIFAPNSVDTFTTFSLTHEIESYSGRSAMLRFIALLEDQLTIAGRWINVDVIGPEDRDQRVHMWLNQEDGRNDDFQRNFSPHERDQCRQYLDGLSTYARFLRFARDFRHEEGYRMDFDCEELDGQTLVVLRLQDACEFLSKKDYTDNWQSEMHETFCFWSFSDWCGVIEAAGLRLHPRSHAFLNPWIVENRYQGKAELFRKADAQLLERLPYPATNMLLVAEKIS